MRYPNIHSVLNLIKLAARPFAAMTRQFATKVTHTQRVTHTDKQSSIADELTLSGAGLALVALHILEALQQR